VESRNPGGGPVCEHVPGCWARQNWLRPSKARILSVPKTMEVGQRKKKKSLHKKKEKRKGKDHDIRRGIALLVELGYQSKRSVLDQEAAPGESKRRGAKKLFSANILD